MAVLTKLLEEKKMIAVTFLQSKIERRKRYQQNRGKLICSSFALEFPLLAV